MGNKHGFLTWLCPKFYTKVQLRMANKESYRLVSKKGEDALLELRCNPEVNLYANTVNAVEGLFCTMKNSCYHYSWG